VESTSTRPGEGSPARITGVFNPKIANSPKRRIRSMSFGGKVGNIWACRVWLIRRGISISLTVIFQLHLSSATRV
jgi:hypothetical protein